MSVLLFSSDLRREEHRIKRLLDIMDQDVEVYRSLERLYERFQKPRGDICLMISVIGDESILNHLIGIKDQMYDLPVVLVLSDTDKETMSKAHKFYPRSITFTGSDYAGLTLALQKIIHRECRGLHEKAEEVAPV